MGKTIRIEQLNEFTFINKLEFAYDAHENFFVNISKAWIYSLIHESSSLIFIEDDNYIAEDLEKNRDILIFLNSKDSKVDKNSKKEVNYTEKQIKTLSHRNIKLIIGENKFYVSNIILYKTKGNIVGIKIITKNYFNINDVITYNLGNIDEAIEKIDSYNYNKKEEYIPKKILLNYKKKKLNKIKIKYKKKKNKINVKRNKNILLLIFILILIIIIFFEFKFIKKTTNINILKILSPFHQESS